jgi:MFS family permease
MSNLFAAALFGVFPVLIWTELKLPPAFYGTVMGLASVGFLVGATLSNRAPRLFGLGPTIVVSSAIGAPAFLLMVLTPPNLSLAAVTLGVGWFVAGLSQVVYNVAQLSLRQAITPPELQSRMNATMRFVVWGTIPIGFVMGGILATIMPVRAALILAALACSTSFLPVALSPLWHLRELPGQDETGEAQTATAAPAPAAPAAPRTAERGDSRTSRVAGPAGEEPQAKEGQAAKDEQAAA